MKDIVNSTKDNRCTSVQKCTMTNCHSHSICMICNYPVRNGQIYCNDCR